MVVASVAYLLSLFARRFTPPSTTMERLSLNERERTFIAVKPDGVQRGLIGEIIKRFEAKGFKLAGMKFLQATEDLLKQHYADLADKPFYPGLCKYMSSGPVVAMCWEGTGVVKTARTMMGETRPADSKPGTIRGDFCIEVGRNIIHGSDSVESANKEIALWFKPEELFSWTQSNECWIYELMDFFGDVTTACGLQTLNNYLQDRSYIRGYTPSKLDAEVFTSLIKAPEENLCHALRWYNHIKSLSVELKLTVGVCHNSTNVLLHQIDESESTKLQTKPFPSSMKEVPQAVNGGGGDEDDDDFDLFGSDDDESESKEAAKLREQRLQEYAEKKSKKPGPIAKSSVMLDVKPWDDETNMKEMENVVRSVCMDGLVWGASKLNPLAFGINKLSILCTVEDEKVSVDDLIDKICEFEDFVQSVDIAAFNKI